VGWVEQHKGFGTLDLEDTLRHAGVWEPAPVETTPLMLAPWGTERHPILHEGDMAVFVETPDPTIAIHWTTDRSEPTAKSPRLQLPDRFIVFEKAYLQAWPARLELRAAGLSVDGRRITNLATSIFILLPPQPPSPDVSLSTLFPLRATVFRSLPPSLALPPPFSSVGVHVRPFHNRSFTGGPLSLRRVQFRDGMGVHAPSQVVYRVEPRYVGFVAIAGVDETVLSQDLGAFRAGWATVVFSVWVDGAERARSPVMRVGLEPWRFHVHLRPGDAVLAMVVDDAGDGNRLDMAIWANAGFLTA